jgi:hypothetical protein
VPLWQDRRQGDAPGSNGGWEPVTI